MDTNSPPFTSGLSFVPDELGWAWAAHLQRQTSGRWLVRWEPGSQNFTAIYLGETVESDVCLMASTPQGLWERILAFDSLPPDLGLGSDQVGKASAWQPRIGSAERATPLRRAG